MVRKFTQGQGPSRADRMGRPSVGAIRSTGVVGAFPITLPEDGGAGAGPGPSGVAGLGDRAKVVVTKLRARFRWARWGARPPSPKDYIGENTAHKHVHFVASDDDLAALIRKSKKNDTKVRTAISANLRRHSLVSIGA